MCPLPSCAIAVTGQIADNYSQTRRSLSWVSFGGGRQGSIKPSFIWPQRALQGPVYPGRGGAGADVAVGAGTCCPASHLPTARLLARAAGNRGLGAGGAKRHFLSGLWRGGFPLRYTEMSVMVFLSFAPFHFRDFSSHPTKLPFLPPPPAPPHQFSKESTRNPVTIV